MTVEAVVFFVSAAVCLAGAVGVVLFRNPVHSVLSLVATLFGIAVLFVVQQAHFLAAVQVIVYAGAIVVLFLFVIMLLGVDRSEDLRVEAIVGQRVAAGLAGLALLALPLVAVLTTTDASGGVIATGARSTLGAPVEDPAANVRQLGEVLFTDYLYALEITSVLLVIAVVGAVVLSKRVKGEPLAIDADLPMHDEEVELGGVRADALTDREDGDGAEAGAGDDSADDDSPASRTEESPA